MIAKLTESPEKWDDVLTDVEFAINNTVNRSTGETPFKLLLGIAQEGLVKDNLKHFLSLFNNYSSNNLTESREKAAKNIGKSQEYNKSYYDKKHKVQKLIKLVTML